MPYTPEQLAQMTGEAEYKSLPTEAKYYDALTMGKDGKLYLEHWSQPKDKREDPTTLGEESKGTILKIRRSLIAWENGRPSLKSVEYDKAENTTVATSLGAMTEKEAKDLHGAKVQLVLYVLLNGHITKLTVSGGSLYNPEDMDDMRLYTYLQSFEEDMHSFMVETIIKTKVNNYTDKGGVEQTNYQLTFKQGDEHTDLTAVGDAITALTEQLVENDASEARWIAKGSAPAPAKTEAVKYPKDEIKPNDVPF